MPWPVLCSMLNCELGKWCNSWEGVLLSVGALLVQIIADEGTDTKRAGFDPWQLSAVWDSSVWWRKEHKCQKWSKQREEEKGWCCQTGRAAEEKSYPVIPSREKFNKFTLCVKTYCRKNYLLNVAAQGNECNHQIVNKIEWKYKINAVWRQMEKYC